MSKVALRHPARALIAALALWCGCMTAMACSEPPLIPVNDLATYHAVPDVVGDQEGFAILCLLRYESVPRRGGAEPSPRRKGTVLRTEPVAGTGRGDRYTIPVTVTYWVASGENSIPDLGGQPAATAQRLIRAAGFRPGDVRQSPDPGPPDRIIGQDPQGGTLATLGSTIAMTVSSAYSQVPDVVGPDVEASGQNVVPDLRGRRLETAGSVLKSAGFVVGVASERVHLGEPGLVLEQNPAPGTVAPLRTAVSVWISKELRVPDVVGMTQDEASSQLGSLGLTAAMAGEGLSPEPRGRVTGTNPVAGAKVMDGSTVRYRMTSGFNRVPDLLGRTPAAAEPLLVAAGFRLGDIETRPDAGLKGLVIGQDPSGGGDSAAPVGQKVDITVSAKSVVPDVVDRPEDEAKRLLGAVGFSARLLGSDPSPRAGGTVLRTQPGAGVEADPGATVSLWAASGKNHVPNLIGQSRARAQALADDAGFKLGSISYRHDPVASARVLQQRPGNEALAPLGAAIDLTLGSATPPVPDLVGKSESQAVNELKQAGMTLAPIQSRYVFTGGGRVLDQAPAAGSVLAPGEQVQLQLTVAKSIVPLISGASALVLLLSGAWWTQLKPWPWHWPPAVAMRVRLETETSSPPPSGLIRGDAPEVRLRTRLEPGESNLDGPLPIVGTETRYD